MAYLLPSNIQKRLLIFALSRLDVLDKESLNLDQLDIAWGRRSSVELRDVKLNVQKLCSLLRFPDALKPTKARILRLRLTVPADIYQSGIEIAIDGVEIQVNFSREDKDASKKSRKRSRNGDIKSAADEDAHLPTTQDITQSFLQEEPLDERRELEAALISQSTQLEGSQALSETSEEDGSLGTGFGFTLPAFLTGMLNGIADRLKVTILDVVLSLETDITPEDAIPGTSFEHEHRIAIKLRADSVDVEGLTTTPNATSQHAKGIAPPNKRRIHWNKIVASLESDPDFFVQLEKYPEVNSPVQSRKSKWHSRTPSDASRAVSSSVLSPTASRSTLSGPRSARLPMESTAREESASPSPQKSPPLRCPTDYDDDTRFADASVDDLSASQRGYGESLIHSEALESPSLAGDIQQGTSNAFEDEYGGLFASKSSMALPASHLLGIVSSDRRSGSSNALSDDSPRNSIRLSQLRSSSPADVDDTEPLFYSRDVGQAPRRQSSGLAEKEHLSRGTDDRLSRPVSQHRFDPSQSSDSRSSSSGRSLDADLSESKIFSHEEAESMYMSAMSGLHSDEKGADQSQTATRLPEDIDGSHQDLPIRPTVQTPLPQTGIRKDDDGLICDTPRASSPDMLNATKTTKVLRTQPTEGKVQPATEDTGNTSQNMVSVPLLTVDGVSLWLPWSDGLAADVDNSVNSPPSVRRTSDDHSVYHAMPGAFSQPAERSQKLRRPPSPHPRSVSVSQRPEHGVSSGAVPEQDSQSVQELDIDIRKIDTALDLSIGAVLLRILQTLTKAFASDNDASEREEQPARSDVPLPSVGCRLSLSISHLTLALLERLGSPSNPAPTTGISEIVLDHSSTLVHLNMSLFSATYLQQASQALVKLDVEKFLFGFPQEHIISFDTGINVSYSRRDLEEQQKNDISLTFRSDETRGQELELFTLPVKVDFDLTKFDDRLSCFGGLSGILDLSSSITSNGTALAPPQANKPASKGVRFVSQPEPAVSDALSPVKINAKIQGVLFTLHGRTCGLSVETSTLNFVVREQMAKVRVAEVVVRGPHLPSYNQSPLRLKISETALLFRLNPEEADLESLVSLITPSRDKYEDDDDILLDTLLRQRRNGPLVKVTVSGCSILVRDIQGVIQLRQLGDEFSKLSNVTKYLPEDDRPGLLSMMDVHDITADVDLNEPAGRLYLHCRGTRAAYVGFPALFATEIGRISLSRNRDELLIGPCLNLREEDTLPMVMARQIGDELEPKFKVKLYNLVLEYRVSALMAFTGLTIGTAPEELVATMAASVANLGANKGPPSLSKQPTDASDTSRSSTTALHLDLLLRDCAIGLNPAETDERGLVLLSDARVTANMSAKEDLKLGLEFRKASVLLIDDTACLDLSSPVQPRPKSSSTVSPALVDLSRQGYASVAAISSARISVQAVEGIDGTRLLNVDVSDKLLVLEACADSLKTLTSLIGGLAPPTPPTTKAAVHTHVMPITDLMASFSGQAFAEPEVEYDDNIEGTQDVDALLDDLPANVGVVGSFYKPISDSRDTDGQSPTSDASQSTVTIGTDDLQPEPPFTEAMEDTFEFDDKIISLVIIENYLDVTSRRGAARGWNSKLSKYGVLYESQTKECPLRLNVKLGMAIINMFDGYDWIKTRETIARAVDDVQEKAERRRRQRQALAREEDEAESEVGDFLFQSIWIAVPPNRENLDLRKQINRQIDDESTTEATTVTTATKTQVTGRPPLTRRKTRGLRLERGKKKISVELRNAEADILVLPPSTDETRLNVDVRVQNLEVFDHVPTSTWNKLATCLVDSAHRQADRPQLHLEILGVKPLPDTPNLEFVVKVKVLPLSLHVDQDTQDFAQRFGAFSDGSTTKESSNPDSDFFIQRIEIESVPVKFDYKPKRLDYAGLRSGRTGELMNLITLDGTSFVLRHVILHGIHGGDNLYKSLHSIWMNDILTNQLPGVLAGLAPIRPLVNVGAGIQDLVIVPMQEYRKDGRIVRSIRKGALAFAKTTTRELARLGARVAIGTQNILEGTEGLLTQQPSSHTRGSVDDDWDDDFGIGEHGTAADKEKRVVSNYANQPLNVVTGVRAAYRGLEKDLMTARDAIIAIGAEVREDGGSVRGVAGAVARHGPAVILRPAIGTSRAIGMALLGTGNMLDSDGQRKVEEKYKRY